YAERLLDHCVGCASGHVGIGGLHGSNEAVAVIAAGLDGMRRADERRWLIAVVPEEGRDEDEQEDERDHDVVVEAPAGIGPVEITEQDLLDGTPGFGN